MNVSQLRQMMVEHRRTLVGAGAVVALLLAAWTAKHTGVGVDQQIDQQYFINNLERLIGPNQFAAVDYGPGSVETSYGYTFQALAFGISWLWSLVLGREFLPFSAATYTDKNVLVVVFAAFTVVALYHLARSLTGRRRVAALASVLLLLTPVFTGHGLMNQKDIPLAAGFTALTAGVVAFLGRLTRGDRLGPTGTDARFGSPVEMAVLLGFGVAFTVGTRPPVGAIVVIDVMLMVIAIWLYRSARPWHLARWAGGGLLVGGVVVMATNAGAWPNPVVWILDSVRMSREFPGWSGTLLVNGSFIPSSEEPKWYLPYIVLMQTPVVIAALAVIGVLFCADRAMAAGGWRRGGLLWVPVGLQVLLPVAGVLQGSLFYNAARQVLFVLPIIALLAAIGAGALWQLSAHWRGRRFVVVAVALLALLPAIDTLTLYPYQYVYFNELQRSSGLTDRFEFDYWGISGRETQGWVNANVPTALEVIPGDWLFEPFATDGIEFARDWSAAGSREMLWVSNYYPSWFADVYGDCPIIHRVTRSLWSQEILLGYVRRCTGLR